MLSKELPIFSESKGCANIEKDIHGVDSATTRLQRILRLVAIRQSTMGRFRPLRGPLAFAGDLAENVLVFDAAVSIMRSAKAPA